MIVFLRKLWVLARPYKARLILGLFFSFSFALTNALLMVIIKLVTDLVFAPDKNPGENLIKNPQWIHDLLVSWLPPGSGWSKTSVLLAIWSLPLVMLIRGLSSYFTVYCMSWAAARTIADLRLRLFSRLQSLSLDFFHTARTGNLISRIISDTSTLHNIIGSSFPTMIKDPITIVSLLILLLSQQPRLTLISLCAFPICILPVIIYGRKARKSSKAIQTHLADLADVMHEAFTGIRVVKAYNLEETVVRRFTEALKKFVSQYMRILRAVEIPGPLIEFLGSVGVSLVFVYAYVHLKPSPGDMLQFVASLFMMYQPIKSLSRLQNQLEQARAASERVFEYMEMESTVVEPSSPVQLRANGNAIEFKNIDFDYGDKPILRGINLTVKAGQMVALVGKSGSGKTTLTNLLLRFYDTQKGSVCIGGTDIRDAATKDLRDQIALVTQQTILFNDTIRNNIALSRPEASIAEIEAAAKHAHAHEFILQKPQGYDTVVGEKGVALSGGQQQRIAIARAILKDAPILVLDEATNALDAESERAVQAALEDLMQGRTTICIAHRLSTIQKADLIVVLDGGRITESGTHAELIRARGMYCKLYELHFEPVGA